MARKDNKQFSKKAKYSSSANNDTKNSMRVDLHVHSQGSTDGVYTIEELIAIAKKNKVEYLAITDHNSITELRNFWKKHGFDLSQSIVEVDGVKIIAGVEVTCKMGKVENVDGNPAKIHMLLYGVDLSFDGPLSQLLELKRINDMNCDFGRLRDLLHKTGHREVSNQNIKAFIRKERLTDEGFNTITDRHIFNFLSENGITIAPSYKQLRNIMDGLSIPNYERMNIEVDDLLDILDGELAVVAHVANNMRRTARTQEFADYLVTRVDGFEKYYPTQNVKYWDVINQSIDANHMRHKIFFTGGSDFHDCAHGEVLGKIFNKPINTNDVKWFLSTMKKLQSARIVGKSNYKGARRQCNPARAREVLQYYRDYFDRITPQQHEQNEHDSRKDTLVPKSSRLSPISASSGENPYHSQSDKKTLINAQIEWWEHKTKKDAERRLSAIPKPKEGDVSEDSEDMGNPTN